MTLFFIKRLLVKIRRGGPEEVLRDIFFWKAIQTRVIGFLNGHHQTRERLKPEIHYTKFITIFPFQISN